MNARRIAAALVLLAALTFAAPPGAAAFHGNTGPIATQNCTTANTIPRLTTASTTAAVLNCTPMTSDGTDVTLASGVLVVPAGSAGTPSIRPNPPDTDSGLFSMGNNTLSISIQGTARMRWGAGIIGIASGNLLAWRSGPNIDTTQVALIDDAANILAQRNGVNAQTLRVYSTFTDASNYERVAISGTGGSNITLLTQGAGTGGARAFQFGVGSAAWQVDANNDFTPVTTNTDNIGSTSLRPLQLFVGTSGIDSTGTIRSSSATGGIGYATGAGGAVTQLTSKSTGVTLNTVTGEITMNAAALAADTAVSFTLTNSAIVAGDHVMLGHVSAGTAGSYLVPDTVGAAGSAVVTVRNITAGSLSEAIVIKFTLIKAVTS